MFYANPSVWGPAVRQYIAEHTYDTISIVETHIATTDTAAQARTHMKDLGYTSAFTLAAPFKHSLAAGGTSAHAKKYLIAADFVSSAVALPGDEDPLDWTAMGIPLKGTTLTVISLYLTPGLGCNGYNAAKLAQVVSWLHLRAAPWIIFADWNATPEQVAQWPVITGLGQHHYASRCRHYLQCG